LDYFHGLNNINGHVIEITHIVILTTVTIVGPPLVTLLVNPANQPTTTPNNKSTTSKPNQNLISQLEFSIRSGTIFFNAQVTLKTNYKNERS